jgi:membrane protease YdiL (CAAX protease family)
VIVPIDRPHSLIELGKQTLFDWEWLLMGFQATVAAPILEEVFYRGILQGWLRRATLPGHLVLCVMTVLFTGVWFSASHKTLVYLDYLPPLAFAGAMAVLYGGLLLRMKSEFRLTATEIQAWQLEPAAPSLASAVTATQEETQALRSQEREYDEARRRRWDDANADLAILGSAMLFAVAHMSAWPGPLALALLAIVLGWLARRTQSLVGPIVLHSLFNLIAFIALYSSMLTAPPKGNAETTAVRPSVFGSTTNSVPASQLPLRK